MSTVTLAELGRKLNVNSAPDITQAFLAAKKKGLDLTNLSAEDKMQLTYWYNRYYGIQVTQMSNLRNTLTQNVKHLALDLVALVKPEVLEAAGLSVWFSIKETEDAK